jgi:hypothetical protein
MPRELASRPGKIRAARPTFVHMTHKLPGARVGTKVSIVRFFHVFAGFCRNMIIHLERRPVSTISTTGREDA